MSDTWAQFATKRHGPAWKTYKTSDRRLYETRKRGAVVHSAEGMWGGIYSVLDSNRQASWHFTVGMDSIEQHYPLEAGTFHGNDTDPDDGVSANYDLIGIECTGRAGTVLTQFQVEAVARICKWAAQQAELSSFARFPEQEGVFTLVEHNEVGNTHTACPSGRVPWSEVMEQLMANEEPEKPWYEPIAGHRAVQYLGYAYARAERDGRELQKGDVHPWDVGILEHFVERLKGERR